MSDDGDEKRGSPSFPAPRARSETNAPYRVVAPTPAATGVPRSDRPAPSVTIATRPSEDALERAAIVTAKAPLAPFQPTEAELRAEIASTAGTRNGYGGTPLRAYLAALMVPGAKWFGAAFLVAGIAMVVYQLIRPPVMNGPVPIITGIGWIFADRISVRRPVLRIVTLWGLAIGSLLLEGWMQTRGWLAP